jgi:diadenylate cyclase
VQELNYYLTQFDWLDVVDIALVTAILFGLLLLIRGTRAVQILRGVLVVGLLFVLALTLVDLPALRWLMSNTLPALLFAIPVIFHPELRRALEQLGRTSQYFRRFRRQNDSPLVNAVSAACQRLSQRRHGALIVFERDTGLQEYVDTGISLDAQPSQELLLTIFNKTTELHDGAVIIRGDRLAAAACVMPLSTSSLSDRQMGLRHRAALGISEVSDAVAVIVSEETGRISIAHNGRVMGKQDPARLAITLHAFLQTRADGAEQEEAFSESS